MNSLAVKKNNQLFLMISELNSLEQLLLYLEECIELNEEIKIIYQEYSNYISKLIFRVSLYQYMIQRIYKNMEGKPEKEKYEYEVVYQFYKKYCNEKGYQLIKKLKINHNIIR